jgi:hypothetical protein
MANKIVLKKSSVSEKVPSTVDLDYGELALNYTDGRLFYKTSNNVISYFDAIINVESFKTVSVANQPDINATNPQSVLSIVAGSGVSITTDAETSSLTISSQSGTTTLGVVARSAFVVTQLTPLMETYLQYDGVSFRENLATVITRDGSVAVLA